MCYILILRLKTVAHPLITGWIITIVRVPSRVFVSSGWVGRHFVLSVRHTELLS